jgi:hypothetical protein
MRSKLLRLLAVSAVGASLLSGVGCGGGGHYYRAYDPYYHDYHPWNHDEVVYYQQWEGDTHRSHVDYRKRKADDQKEYWTWRHSHDHDHDHDHH